MIEKVKKIVENYVLKHLDKSDFTNDKPSFEVFIVWQCKALQNWKFLLSTSLLDGMYYEVTFNGDKNEFYLDAYKKFENVCIEDKKPSYKNIPLSKLEIEGSYKATVDMIIKEQEQEGYKFIGIISDPLKGDIIRFRRDE